MSHNLPVDSRELATSVCDTLRRNGHQALLVGGCVRDLRLGREPLDYDVATDAHPDIVLSLFPDALAVGAQFGVVLLSRGDHKVEIATFRSDIGSADGRHPDSVIFSSSPQEDVQRRDFTINGLLMRHDTEEILDYVGGRADLQAGIIRTIGNPALRFAEDKLRMLRAVRFAARFAFPMESGTFQAVRDHAGEISQVSAERIRDELTRMLTEGAAKRAFELLHETNLLEQVLPEISAMQGVSQPPEYHPEGDVWVHTLLMLQGLPAGVSPTLAWGVLLHDVGKPLTFRSAAQTGDRIRFDGHAAKGVEISEAICRRLRFSNEDTSQILALVANHMRFMDVKRMRLSTLKRFLRLPHFDQHLALHRLDCLSSHRRLDAYNFVTEVLHTTPAEEIRPTRWLTGDDLINLGYQRGPLLSKILAALEDAQLEGQIGSRDQAVEFVDRTFGPTRNLGKGLSGC